MLIQRLKADQLTCTRGQRGHTLFSKLSFTMNPGEGYWVSGPNGCGKSSLLAILAGLIEPAQGHIYWKGQPIAMIKPHYLAELAWIGHRLPIKKHLTLRENIDCALKLKRLSLNQKALRVLDEAELTPCLSYVGYELSAGQAQRAALSLAIIDNASLWLIDEPLNALDTQATQWWQHKASEHMRQGGMLIVTSHQPLNIPEQSLKTLCWEANGD